MEFMLYPSLPTRSRMDAAFVAVRLINLTQRWLSTTGIFHSPRDSQKCQCALNCFPYCTITAKIFKFFTHLLCLPRNNNCAQPLVCTRGVKKENHQLGSRSTCTGNYRSWCRMESTMIIYNLGKKNSETSTVPDPLAEAEAQR